MKRILLLALLCMLFSGCAGPAGDSGELLEDFDCFFRQFELAHPDPYSAFGGKRSFRRGVKALRRELGSSRELTADAVKNEGISPKYKGIYKNKKRIFMNL